MVGHAAASGAASEGPRVIEDALVEDAVSSSSAVFAPSPRGMATFGRRPGPKGSFSDIDWSKPWFAQFGARGVRWQQAALASESALLAEMNADAERSGQTTGCGQRLAFIAQDDLAPGSAYEAHIAATGCVPTRHNLHDFFNALTWFQFPRIKATLNARQSAAIDALGVGPTRGGTRDALTLFDENAVLFASVDPALSTALRTFPPRRMASTVRSALLRSCAAGKADRTVQGMHRACVDRGGAAGLFFVAGRATRCVARRSRERFTVDGG